MTIRAEKLSWDQIDTVLLDLDGTLLDLAFDNDFWLDCIPVEYAAARSLPLEEARAELTRRFRAREGTLEWYCIDFWSRELGVNVAALKRRHADRVAWLPGAEEFLLRLRASGRRLVLLTNSHPQVLRIKDERTGVLAHMDAAFSSHYFGAPKESPDFWNAVRQAEPFDPQRSLFIDDSPAVLHAARVAGIRWLCGVRRADSKRAAKEHRDILAVDAVSDLDPGPPCEAGRHGAPAAGARDRVPRGPRNGEAADGIPARLPDQP